MPLVDFMDPSSNNLSNEWETSPNQGVWNKKMGNHNQTLEINTVEAPQEGTVTTEEDFYN